MGSQQNCDETHATYQACWFHCPVNNLQLLRDHTLESHAITPITPITPAPPTPRTTPTPRAAPPVFDNLDHDAVDETFNQIEINAVELQDHIRHLIRLLRI